MKHLPVILSVFLFCPMIFGQTQNPDIAKCDHITTSNERFELMRISPPSKVTYYDGQKIEFVHSDSKGVYLHTFEIDEDSIIRADFKKNWKTGYWWIIYCARENHIYAISRVDPKQLK